MRLLLPKRAVHVLGGIVLLFLASPLMARSLVQNKQLARSQFQKAEQMREELNGRPAQERTRSGYQRVIDAYRRVYYVAPTSTKADSSVVAVAELMVESGRRFNDPKTLRAAIGQYEFLRREYPGSRHRVEALFTIGQIYQSDLNDPAQAKATFQEFLKRYPRSKLTEDARNALAELDRPAEKADKKKREPEAREASITPVSKNAPISLVTGIRYWSTPDYTRVAIDLEAEVQYQAGRVPNPDRIFFDLHNTRLSSTLVGKSFDVQDGFLRKIRVAQFVKGITRVVLDVDDVSDYSAFLLPNPYRLIIDIHGRHAGASQLAEKKEPVRESQPKAAVDSKPEPSASARSSAAARKPQLNEAGVPRAWTTVSAREGRVADGTITPLKPELAEIARSAARPRTQTQTVQPQRTSALSTKNAEAQASDRRPAPTSPAKSNESPRATAEATGSSTTKAPVQKSAGLNAKPEASPVTNKASVVAADRGKAEGKSDSSDDESDTVTVAHLESPDLERTKPTSAPTFETVAPRPTLPRGKRHTTQASVHEARPTANGERSLTRALGLKIGRIVVDAGHGGHDTGTIGPNGLQEKDLVLDVALRLGKLLEAKLGADVIYTRDDDTFIPLETRTAIANQNQADLFISIHANSSADAAARGIETYYLNFTSSPDALEVAARENAVSQQSIHELQSLVKKIALKEKIEESREFAMDVQRSLWSGMAAKTPAIRNRGVRKAPFVVLIGANMPSILAEISFLSNPTDERHLEKPEYRQKIAEYLYRGIARYANGLSGVKVATKR